MPKISVLMPVYNTEESYLREAIESILNQTYTDFEFLILNDGSKTNAEEIILSYKDDRISYIKNEQNLGLIKTLNKGLDLAKGEYIARMDSDDISLPERFERQVQFLDTNPDIDVVGTWFNYIPKNRVIKTFTQDKDIKECLLVNSNNIGHPTVMLRKSIVENLGARYDEKYSHAEDYALWLSLIDKVKFANLPEVLLNYRIHRNNISRVKRGEQSLNAEKIKIYAQSKYFNLDNSSAICAIEKLQNGRKISSKELVEINNFTKQVRIKIEEQVFGCDYNIDKTFYKFAIKKCKKDLLFFKLALSGELNRAFKSIHIGQSIKKNEDTNPLVSAVMALYNTPYKILETTMEHILSQTHADFELIVIDDGSSQNYQKFFGKFNDERIKYFKLEKNFGPGYARNVGMKKALGKYIAIVDSDDIYMPKRFELQTTFLEENPEISLLGGSFKFSNRKILPKVIESDEEIKTFLLFNSPFANPLVMFRKNFFIKNNLFYPEGINFAEDYSLWIDAMFTGIKMANLKDIMMVYARRKNQLSKTKIETQTLILKKLYRKIFSHLNMELSEKELELHHSINLDNFKAINSSKEIENWFDKIIESNKNSLIFDEDKLIEKKNQTVALYEKMKNQLCKIKIGEYNICLGKNLRLYIEERD